MYTRDIGIQNFIIISLSDDDSLEPTMLSLTPSSLTCSALSTHRFVSRLTDNNTLTVIMSNHVDGETSTNDELFDAAEHLASSLFAGHTSVSQQLEHEDTLLPHLGVHPSDNLRTITLCGRVRMNITFPCAQNISLSVVNGANLTLHLTGQEVTVDLIESGSRLCLHGPIQSLFVDRLDEGTLLDLSNIEFNEFVLGIFQGLLTMTDVQMNQRITWPDGHEQDVDLSSLVPVETRRQRWVRKHLQIAKTKNTVASSPETTCQLCLEFTINAVCNPCGHTHMCIRCANKIKEQRFADFLCPWCKVPVMKIDLVSEKNKDQDNQSLSSPPLPSSSSSSFSPFLSSLPLPSSSSPPSTSSSSSSSVDHSFIESIHSFPSSSSIEESSFPSSSSSSPSSSSSVTFPSIITSPSFNSLSSITRRPNKRLRRH